MLENQGMIVTAKMRDGEEIVVNYIVTGEGLRAGTCTIDGKEINCGSRIEKSQLYVEIYNPLKNLPESFFARKNYDKKTLNMLKKQSMLIAFTATSNGQALAAIETAKAAEARHQEELKNLADNMPIAAIAEVAYTIGCDYPSYVTVKYDDAVIPAEATKKYRDDSKLVLNHVKLDGIRKFAETLPHEKLEATFSTYGGYKFIGEAAQTIIAEALRIEGERLEKLNQKKLAEESKEAAQKEAAQGREIYLVECESRPHCEDLSGVILNSPAPNNGAFLVYKQIPKEIWREMVTAGANYYNAEYLEDCDMFGAKPGWRYSLEAIERLIIGGFAVLLDGEIFITGNSLRAHYATAPQPKTVEIQPRKSVERCRVCGLTGTRGAYPFSTVDGYCDDCA